MPKDKNLYLTTTLPYVNDNPHIGFALELVEADIIARLNRLLGREVFFSTGTDEHGLKIYKKAQEEGQDIKDYVDKYAKRFAGLKETLNLSYDNFIRTTSQEHKKAAQEFWKRCDANGDIYKKKYKGLYCVGCERFVKESELENGRCLHHPTTELQELEEENYFFKFENYSEKLLDYLNKEEVILPDWRREEAIKFIEEGLEDFSISRVREKMPWGVSVPGDESQVMYVWFDALINYISTLGWPSDKEGNFKKFWDEGVVLQLGGKDQVRFQSLMWQAMLMSAGIKNTDTVIYHGFITSKGQKMSKSIGNVIDPLDLVDEYGADALRYFLARHIHPYEDSDFTEESFKEAYNGNLANSLGNLVSRVIKMVESYDVKIAFDSEDREIAESEDLSAWRELLKEYQFSKTMDYIWGEIAGLEKYIAETEPYKLIKTDEEKAKEIIAYLSIRLWDISVMLLPFMPETSAKIQEYLVKREVAGPLFRRK